MKEICGKVHPLFQVKCQRPPGHESILHLSVRIEGGLPREVVWSTRKQEVRP